jgi:nitrite reductase/ring-hydroxylating ferredoxin subunit
VKEGTIHGVINVVSIALFGLSLFARRKNKRGRGVLFSSSGLALVTFSAWLGGELVSRLRVGVNHTKTISTHEDWIAVLPDSELAEHEARRVDVNGEPVVLYRYGGRISAFAAACSHNAGPLDKGIFNRYQVQCPWHASVFDVRDGCVIHGPATHDQPTLQVRIRNNQIEVCA